MFGVNEGNRDRLRSCWSFFAAGMLVEHLQNKGDASGIQVDCYVFKVYINWIGIDLVYWTIDMKGINSNKIK
jgi:hypothetical protein